MNVLSLFDGLSCGQIALERAGIPYDKYYASEIDKHAIKVTQHNYPNTIQLGDVTTLKVSDLPKIDILFAGFPCQAWSRAGKQGGLKDCRGQLAITLSNIFEELKKINLNMYFLFENVRMKKENLEFMDNLFGVKHIMLTSSLVSAQNRVRCYWTNIPNVKQPEDQKIYLEDILQKDVNFKDYLLKKKYWKGSKIEEALIKNMRAVAFTERRTEEAKRIRKEYSKLFKKDFSPRRGKELVVREDGKMNCLTATYSIKEHTLIDNLGNYRKLTPVECEKLQTLPSGYTEGISNNQRYKCIGNGWTVDIITHILKNMGQGTKGA